MFMSPWDGCVLCLWWLCLTCCSMFASFFWEYLMLDVYIYFYLLQLLVNWPFYHYKIFISLHFFLQFILSDITVSPALFRMGCLFPSFHFSPFHVFRFVDTTCLKSLTNSVSLAWVFLLLLFLVNFTHAHPGGEDRHPGLTPFRATVISEGMYWMFRLIIVFWGWSLITIFFHILLFCQEVFLLCYCDNFFGHNLMDSS